MDNANRQRERRGNGNNPDPENNDPQWWEIAVGVAAGVAAVVGGLYLLSSQAQAQEQSKSDEEESSSDEFSNSSLDMDNIADGVSRMAVSPVPRVNNLNSLLNDIYVRYIAIKRDEFEEHYSVFMNVFYQLHSNMKAVDPYYERYSSRVQFAGSHYDRLRIKKPDEFDMDIVIGLPVNIREDPLNPEESDVIIEPKQGGYVQLRAGTQYLKILGGKDIYFNQQALLWLDDRKYILNSKFVSWFKSTVDRALNRFEQRNGFASVTIRNDVYTIRVSSSGPAYTLVITNRSGFKLDVDLVPTLRFPEERWLGSRKAYRDIPKGCSADYWMVVPKPNKYGANGYDEKRSWRVAMHDQERKLIHNSYHFRHGIRFLKKLRDVQNMNHIKSYHIKTLFLWKISELNDPYFWQQDVATIFKVMLREFYKALVDKKINYFWNKRDNMIENVPEHILKGYANKLAILTTALENDQNYMWAAKYLLTSSEYVEYMELLDSST